MGVVIKNFVCVILLFCLMSSCSYKNKETEFKDGDKKLVLAKEDEVLNKVLSMSLDEKIGQLFIVGIDGNEKLSEQDKIFIKDVKVGGIIFFRKNISSVPQTVGLINEIKNLNEISGNVPLFLSLDQEGGIVTRLPEDVVKFKSAREIGNINDENYAYLHFRLMGEVIRNLGFNMNFAPVLDVYTNKNNRVIGSRSFSSDKEIVSKMANATLKAFNDEKIISVGKHYPGHGDTNEDSHYELPVLSHDYNRINEIELYPFKNLIQNNIPALLVSHLMYENIDSENIATTSEIFLQNILRDGLKFRGIVITDDMIMKGLTNKYTIDEASLKAIKSGVDVILISSGFDDIISSFNKIKNGVLNGEISEFELDKKVYNILRIKKLYEVNNNPVENFDIIEINSKIKKVLNKN